MPTAIQTRYKGYHFRSRLEARWAVFFDAIGVEWGYEVEGYEYNGERYLPDFELKIRHPYRQEPARLFVEVKGDLAWFPANWERMSTLFDFGGCLPGFANSAGSLSGLIIVSEVPQSEGFIFHPVLQHHKGICVSWGTFVPAFGNQAVFEVANDTPLTRMLGINPEYGLESSPDEWRNLESREITTKWHYPTIKTAYRNARAARFEF